jgi:hypothetical protein
VNRIASGKRPAELVRKPREEEGPEEPTGPPERCAECGALVVLPCRACHTRNQSKRTREHVRAMALLNEPLGLELRPAHQRRYEEVRARRERMALEVGHE